MQGVHLPYSTRCRQRVPVRLRLVLHDRLEPRRSVHSKRPKLTRCGGARLARTAPSGAWTRSAVRPRVACSGAVCDAAASHARLCSARVGLSLQIGHAAFLPPELLATDPSSAHHPSAHHATPRQLVHRSQPRCIVCRAHDLADGAQYPSGLPPPIPSALARDGRDRPPLSPCCAVAGSAHCAARRSVGALHARLGTSGFVRSAACDASGAGQCDARRCTSRWGTTTGGC
jgi:hypothetical protein